MPAIVNLANYLLLAGAAASLIHAARQLRGTTLFAPCCWGLLSLLAIACVQVAANASAVSLSGLIAWRLLAATTTLCPGIALLGAKRPQNRPWQWIVASLWLVLSLPAIQFLVLGKGGTLELHPARTWFMFGLIAFTIANSIICRDWLAILLAGCGQAALFSVLVPMGDSISTAHGWDVGISLISGAAIFLFIRRRFRSPSTLPPLDRVWHDFRDAFGMVWSVRLMEQLNSAARTNGWDVTLQWSGFRAADGISPLNLAPQQFHVLQQSVRNLLRRFVTPKWLAERLGQDT